MWRVGERRGGGGGSLCHRSHMEVFAEGGCFVGVTAFRVRCSWSSGQAFVTTVKMFYCFVFVSRRTKSG